MKGKESPPGSPWPMPHFMNGTSDRVLFLRKKNFQIKTNLKVECDIISENVKHYRNVIFPPKIYNAQRKRLRELKYLNVLKINIVQSDECPGYPNSNMIESCKFKIKF